MKTLTNLFIFILTSFTMLTKSPEDSNQNHIYLNYIQENRMSMAFDNTLDLDTTISLRSFIKFYTPDSTGVSAHDSLLKEYQTLDSINSQYEQELYKHLEQ